jgi:hypothetical protein
MSDQTRDTLSDLDIILDRAARHEEVRFLKKQQWAVATAGAVLSGAFLATVSNYHMTALDRFLAVVLLVVGVGAGWFFLDDLQRGLARVRRALDPADYEAATRGSKIVNLHKAILVASAGVVGWAVLFKVH